MIYVSLPSEVDTLFFIQEALKQGKRVAVPFLEPGKDTVIASELRTFDDLVKGPFGILQPKHGLTNKIPLEEIGLVVVPAIAFSKDNMRLGRGKGYFDRFLAEEKLSPSKVIGLAFRFQILENLPHDFHDRPVSCVITD